MVGKEEILHIFLLNNNLYNLSHTKKKRNISSHIFPSINLSQA